MSKTKGSKAGEVLDVEQGKANVAANLTVEIPVNEPGKRGRKPSNKLTFAKFSAAIKAGTVPDGVKYVPQSIDPNTHMVTWGHFETENPSLDLDEEGNLSLALFVTEGRNNKPAVKPIRTISSAEVMALLTK